MEALRTPAIALAILLVAFIAAAAVSLGVYHAVRTVRPIPPEVQRDEPRWLWVLVGVTWVASAAFLFGWFTTRGWWP